jgi:ABC-type multidrug transport system ATPase subunit
VAIRPRLLAYLVFLIFLLFLYSISGKTTLSSIIGCEIVPTGGDVTVFGHSVINEPYAVRGLVGVCKQFDYLYPNLSAKEHLVLFAGLRGVPREFVAETVDKWLESVDLHVVQNQFSSGFSGGMRRRLSLACATIGGRPLLILDEPTTGAYCTCTCSYLHFRVPSQYELHLLISD